MSVQGEELKIKQSFYRPMIVAVFEILLTVLVTVSLELYCRGHTEWIVWTFTPSAKILEWPCWGKQESKWGLLREKNLFTSTTTHYLFLLFLAALSSQEPCCTFSFCFAPVSFKIRTGLTELEGKFTVRKQAFSEACQGVAKVVCNSKIKQKSGSILKS